MARVKALRVLVASDGSLSATAAVVTASCFPWPVNTRASGLVARDAAIDYEWPALTRAREEAAASTADATAKALARRWSDVRVDVEDGPPAAAIIRAARRNRADVIVMGWRGHGPARRLMTGSVSRDVVRLAPCSVLVVRRAVRRMKTIVIGVDGSEQSLRAVALAGRLEVPSGGHIVLVTAVPLLSDPSNPLLPSAVRAAAASGIADLNKQRLREARERLTRLAVSLRGAGWRVDTAVPNTAPLQALLAAATRSRADLMMIGATGTSRIEQLLLGSVAQGALDRSAVPVVVAR